MALRTFGPLHLGTALAEAYAGQWPQVAICVRARAAWVRPRTAVDLLDLAWGDEPRPLTQQWGRRIYEQQTDLDGIVYRAAHQGGEAVVLWDRAPALVRLSGGDRRPWAVWAYVQVALGSQGRQPRRVAADDRPACRRCGYAG